MAAQVSSLPQCGPRGVSGAEGVRSLELAPNTQDTRTHVTNGNVNLVVGTFGALLRPTRRREVGKNLPFDLSARDG